jgi:hypothetical protein
MSKRKAAPIKGGCFYYHYSKPLGAAVKDIKNSG